MDFNNQNLHNTIGEAEEDRISELPDSLLHYILSFLDNIKHVARTCVLSKRWKHIWTSIPTLDLQFWEMSDSPPLSEVNKFMDFVDRTLHLHHASNIQKFKLNLFQNMNPSRVHSWIENLTSRNVEELILNLDYNQDIPLSIPVSLLTCESLTKLELSDGPSIHFPKNIFFPKLKSLKLSGIQFGDNGCWNEEPFSNCLILEELFLHDCNWFGMMRKFYILTPVLKVLEISNMMDAEGLQDCGLKIDAPSLVSLCFWGPVAKDYDMSSFITLDEAEVVFYCFDFGSGRVEQWISQAVSTFLRSLSHVRRLSLYIETDQVLPVANRFVSNPPTYHNMNTLLLEHAATSDKMIFAFLKAAPNLKYLTFKEFYHSSHVDEEEYDETEDLFRHLKSVYFGAFSGRKRELRWSELILKNAKSLQIMTIAYGTPSSNASTAKSKEVVMSELLSFTRASWRCRVKFV